MLEKKEEEEEEESLRLREEEEEEGGEVPEMVWTRVEVTITTRPEEVIVYCSSLVMVTSGRVLRLRKGLAMEGGRRGRTHEGSGVVSTGATMDVAEVVGSVVGSSVVDVEVEELVVDGGGVVELGGSLVEGGADVELSGGALVVDGGSLVDGGALLVVSLVDDVPSPPTPVPIEEEEEEDAVTWLLLDSGGGEVVGPCVLDVVSAVLELDSGIEVVLELMLGELELEGGTLVLLVLSLLLVGEEELVESARVAEGDAGEK